jgi:hypothetical protein
MGPPPATLKPSPDQFLRTGTGTQKLPAPGQFKYSGPRKPPVPKPGDEPIHGLPTTTNFIRANVLDATITAPKPRPGADVDYTKRPGFGQVPAYLSRVKREVEEEYELVRTLIAAEDPAGTAGPSGPGAPGSLLAEGEREALLAALRKNWAELNAEYASKLCFLPDTQRQKARREAVEAKLEQLEKDIQLLERGTIVVTN